MKTILTFFLALQIIATDAQDKKIAITIDDLPCTNCSDIESATEVNHKLLSILKAHHVPAIGFVNEGKLYMNGGPDQKGVEILRQWLGQGMELGNHTYSHISIDNATVKQYEADLLKGEKITRRLMREYGKELTWFRHTQLRTGPTLEYKNQLDAILKKYNYKTAPVTMDNDEYVYAQCYRYARLQNDSVGMRLIAYDYFNYMDTIFNYYESLSKTFLSYHVNQVLLLHANELNADHLDVLLSMLKQRNYTFVSLAEAVSDSAYQLPEVQSTRGLSWIHRWQLASGSEITQHPDVSDKISKRRIHYSQQKGIYTAQQTFHGNKEDIDLILNSKRNFSSSYVQGDYEGLARSYTSDGKIFPGNTDIK